MSTIGDKLDYLGWGIKGLSLGWDRQLKISNIPFRLQETDVTHHTKHVTYVYFFEFKVAISTHTPFAPSLSI